MKIKYPVIGIILIFIIMAAFETKIPYEISNVLGILFFVCLCLIIYLVIRNIFQAIIEVVKKPKEP